ncbi:type I-E CRISPR-associated protein Cse1/CasA [Streptomyces sp. WAC 00631]|uniref:type I-E CRISPR-associated protein Cse1/CasA n=1 Tax=Streptomyces sp. WAC 00631 TaxID=2203201 RepID=UPI000F79B3EA|nr:type I-E CRISPR-associated protein Cse1/CasA [Streptomyces sp. WAC 00631]MCC5033490.1 type I-E CRISPR-associated protein Cse1/CasA [Streptomyces sp. WAC 00631]
MLFHLLDDPWLATSPAGETGADGSRDGQAATEVGVRELILDSHRFLDLVVGLPTQKPAIFRQVLLPVVVDALGRPADAGEWTDMFRAGKFSAGQREKLTAYLDEHHARFSLFDPANPFAQVAGLRTAKGETKSSALLVATAATGNNVPLFSSRTEGDPPPLTPAEAARWLLHTHCWDTAAIKTGAVGDPQMKKGKTTGNPTGPLGQLGVTMPMGRTVYETLLLNIPYGPPLLSDDLPQWRRRAADGTLADTLSCGTPAWQTRASRGLLDVWTWQSRRIRLVPEQTPDGPRVTRVIVAAGDRLTAIPDHEPHTAWIIDSAGARAKKTGGGRAAAAVARPRRHQPGKAAWRGLEALLAVDREQSDATATRAGFHTSVLLSQLSVTRERLPATYPLQVELTGITYGNQSAVVEDLFFDTIPLPLTALDADGILYGCVLEAADQAEKLATAVNHLSADVRRAAGSDPIPWDKGQRPGETLLHSLDPLMRRLLTGLRKAGEDFDAAERGLLAWEHKAAAETWTVAEQVLSTAAPSTFTGRTITHNGKEHTYRLSTAERGFRRRLDEVLTRRAAERKAARAAVSPDPTDGEADDLTFEG